MRTVSLLLVSLVAFAYPLASGADDAAGFIYGTVTTEDGRTFTGPIRWEDEEVFWTDHFNGSKDGND